MFIFHRYIHYPEPVGVELPVEGDGSLQEKTYFGVSVEGWVNS